MNFLGRFFTEQENAYHKAREDAVRTLDPLHIADNPYLLLDHRPFLT